MKLQEKIVNTITNETTFRDYTEEQLTQVETAKLETEYRLLKENEIIAAKLALFNRLGITEDEAKLLLGL